MSQLLATAVAGGLIGAGAFIAVRALTIEAPSLARIAADLQRPAADRSPSRPRLESVGRRIAP